MKRKSALVSLALVVSAILYAILPVSAQSTVTAQIETFWRQISTATNNRFFTTLGMVVNGHINFGTTLGDSGYGIRDSAGIIQIKNSGGAWSAPTASAPTSSKYIIQTVDGSLPNAQAMSALPTALVMNTTATGVQSGYGGTSCTNQFPRSLSAIGIATCSAVLGATDISGTIAAANFPAMTGDVTSAGATLATTLATVNGNVGSFGSSTAIATFTVNGKGLITAAANVTPQLTLTNTYFSSLSGANLTNVPTSAFTGTIQAAQFPILTGDVTTPGGSLATTVAKIGGNAVALGGALTFSGAFTTAITVTGNTAVTLPTAGTLVSTTVTSLPSLSSVGTIGTGTWQGTLIAGQYGGTGVNNSGKTITLGGNFTTSGAFTTTLTVTNNTNVTLPVSGTLITTTVGTLSSLVSVGTLTTGIWNATPITADFGGTGATTLTAHGALIGEGVGTVVSVAGGTNCVLFWTGAGSDPTCSSTPTLTTIATQNISNTVPTLSSGFGASPGLTSGTATAFEWNVGTGGVASTGVVAMNDTAAHGWACSVADITTPATNMTQQTGTSTTAVTVTNYVRTTGVAGAWTASDHLAFNCQKY